MMTAVAKPILQPLGMGQLLDRAIRIYRRNFLKFVGIIALTQIPNSALAILITLFASDPTTFINPTSVTSNFGALIGQALGIGFVIVLISIVLTQVATAALTQAVADDYLGEPAGILDTYRKIGNVWLSLIGALLLTGLLAIALFIWTLVPLIGWLTGAGMIIYLTVVVIPLIAPVIVLEQQSAGNAIARTWALARRRFWWLLGFTILLYIFSQLIITGPTLLATFLLTTLAGGSLDLATSNSIQQIISLLFTLVYLPLQLTCITLLYFDVRVRTEGFDLVLQAAQDDTETTGKMSRLIAQAPRQHGSMTPTLNEMAYFAAMEIGIAAVLFVLFVILSIIGLALGTAFGGF